MVPTRPLALATVHADTTYEVYSAPGCSRQQTAQQTQGEEGLKDDTFCYCHD